MSKSVLRIANTGPFHFQSLIENENNNEGRHHLFELPHANGILYGLLAILSAGAVPLGVYILAKGVNGIRERRLPFSKNQWDSGILAQFIGALCLVIGLFAIVGGATASFLFNLQINAIHGHPIVNPERLLWDALEYATRRSGIVSGVWVSGVILGYLMSGKNNAECDDDESGVLGNKSVFTQCVVIAWMIMAMPGILLLIPFKKTANSTEYSYNTITLSVSLFIGWWTIFLLHYLRNRH